MGSRNPGIDAYIARQADFARPILTHLRDAVHAACPAIEESLKWSAPAFSYKGKALAGMAAFKAHAGFGFWQGEAVTGQPPEKGAMGDLGKLTRIEDVPDDATFHAWIERAMALIDEGARPAPAKHARAPIAMPADFRTALDGTPEAARRFDAFPPGARHEYLDWIVGAKRAETRARRIAEAVGWIAEGKKRHWKYEAC